MAWKTPKLRSFARAILSFNKEEELLDFLRDVHTLEELEEVSNRWQIVQLLNNGMSYRAVAKEAGVSTTTVTRIAHWMKHGKGGYTKALKQADTKE
ncbi:trp operon repressor [Patescibacteria group bacterium]|nr:trp operon repressor [Patescibacteria group bacterium]MBU1721351.1 trp operon repressor [Patescibacteria group bacterium]MBU1901559.1 trp operon repressor [Patescibacteria group bacterium]